MKSNKKRGGRTGSIVALCIVLVLTVVLGVLGAAGWSIPPKGLYRVMPWLPNTDAEAWPEVLPLGLDLRGGMYVEYSAKAPEGSEANFEELMNGTMSIIQQRLADKGFTEANVQQIGGDGIRVEIPDVQDDTVLDLIGAAAKLEFRDPQGNVFMTGDMVKTATYYYSEGDHQVAFTLTDEGTKVFGDMTSKSIGQRIAIYLDGEELISPTVESAIIKAIGGFIPGIPVPTPILIVCLMGCFFGLVFRFTTMGLYMQTVGINQGAARLNGINAIGMKLLAFVLLGLCCAVSGVIGVSRLQLINHETLLLNVEMDAILAVAIGGNSLGGGKFKMVGSVLGAYVIQALTITLYAMKVSSTDVKAYKAVVIILLVVLGSPVVKAWFGSLKNRLAARKSASNAGKEAA